MNQTVDFNIRNIVRIRLVNASEKDIKAVINQIGDVRCNTEGTADITVKFFDQLETGKLNLLGLNGAFDEHHYYILRSSKAPCVVRFPFEQLGEESCEISCQSGLRSVPLLLAAINLSLIAKNYLPLHASAFEYGGIAHTVMGWAKGGKTETMLAFANHGSYYIADEWTVFSPKGEVFGIPEPIRLWDWHIRQIPHLQPLIKGKKKLIFATIHGIDAMMNFLSKVGLSGTFPFSAVGEALPAMKRQLNLRIHPEIIFQKRLKESGIPQTVFLIGGHASPEITVQPISPSQIAERMLHSNLLEFSPLFEHYRAFRFAFPQRENRILENFESIQRKLIDQLFDQHRCYHVLHPYPVDFEELFAIMRPYCILSGESQKVVNNEESI